MNDTLPSAILVRVTHTEGGEPRSSITLDTSADRKAQRELHGNLRSVAEPMAQRYGMRLPADAHIEILTGHTANKIERLEDLLNDCRNLLIDLDVDESRVELARIMDRVMEDLDRELGV